MNLVVAKHRVGDAVEVTDRILIFHANLDNAGPMAPLQEARPNRIDKLSAGAAGLLHKIGDRPANNLLKGQADKIGEPAVDSAQLAIKRDGQENIVKGIDQIPIALLRALDHREELVNLFAGHRSSVTLLHSAKQAAKLGN